MEQKEIATQQKKKIPADEKNSQEEDKAATPATPTGSGATNWWGGWISQAKEKSASVLQAVKNDLEEISVAVTETFQIGPVEDEDEVEPLPSTSSAPDPQKPQQSTVNYMKQSLSSFFGTVTDALIPQIDEEDVSEAVLITNDDTIVLTGFSKHLAQLQSNDETYLEEPTKSEELAEKYRMWLEIVEQDQFTQQKVNKMLESSQILNEKYNKFVPDTVSHMNFFKRYLFKKALLEDELASEERLRREVVIKKQPETVAVAAEPITAEPEAEVKEIPMPSLKTEISDLDIANFELSEEEQAKLLSDYEQEIKEREKSKAEVPELPQVVPKTATKSSKNPSKSSSNVQSKGKNNKNVKFNQQQKSTQQPTPPAKGVEKGKKPAGELKIQNDHFKKESESSTSDESWEKEFDL